MEEKLKQLIKEAIDEYLQEHPLMKQESTKEIMNVDQLSEYLGVSKNWIYQNMGKIPHLKIGGNVRFRLDKIEEWQEEQKFQEPSYGKIIIRRIRE